MMKAILVSLISVLASTAVSASEISELAKSTDNFFDSLMKEEFGPLLSSDDLNQVLRGKALSQTLMGPLKSEFFEGESFVKVTCHSNGSPTYQHIQLRQAISRAINNCIAAGNLGCKIMGAHIVNEEKCTAVAFATAGGLKKESLVKLDDLKEVLGKLKDVSSLLSPAVKSGQALLATKISLLIQSRESQKGLLFFSGKSNNTSTCYGNGNIEYRTNQLRQAFNNAMADCHRAGYLKCEKVNWFGNPIAMYLGDFDAGLIVDEENCEARMWVVPVAD